MRKPPRNGGGRPKIDWGAARSYFARHPEIAYADVAEKFGVSDTAVRNHAREEDWEGYRADVIAAVAARRRTADIRALEKRQDDTIRLIDELRDLVFDGLDTLDLTAVMRALPRYLRHEQLIAGEATDVFSVAEAHALFKAIRSKLEGKVSPEELAQVLVEAAKEAAIGEREEAPA